MKLRFTKAKWRSYGDATIPGLWASGQCPFSEATAGTLIGSQLLCILWEVVSLFTSKPLVNLLFIMHLLAFTTPRGAC